LLRKPKERRLMEYSVRIAGDVNDADYEYKEFDMVKGDETHQVLLKFIKFLKETKFPGRHNNIDENAELYEEYFTEEELDGYIHSFIPTDYGSGDDAHTIESVEITPKIKWERLF
jgi:hypothetical protein